MRRFELTDEQWEKIKHLLPGKEGDSRRTAKDKRLIVDVVLWTARTGAQWRDLPARFGNWNSIYQRFNRWAKAKRWQAIFEAMQDLDLERLRIDATIVRAHQHAAGALKKGETKHWDDPVAAGEPRSTSPAKDLDCQYASY